MLIQPTLVKESVRILSGCEKPSIKHEREIMHCFEDANSPVTSRYLEKLYMSVISKSHIDFDNIPQSAGDIEKYVGYKNMVAVLDNIDGICANMNNKQVQQYTLTVREAINNIRKLAPIYKKGFMAKNEYVMLEYDTFVYTCIQATSTLLYEFVDYMKRPDMTSVTITLKNTKYRANTFYIDQLAKYNAVNKKMQYAKYLEGMLSNGKDNFVGAYTAIGVTAVIAVALAIIPVMRELIYQFYNIRTNISDALAQQAYFLELNKACVEANSSFSKEKKADILMKQEKAKNMCLRLSDKLRVTHAKSMSAGEAAIRNDSKYLTLDNIKNGEGGSASSLQLL